MKFIFIIIDGKNHMITTSQTANNWESLQDGIYKSNITLSEFPNILYEKDKKIVQVRYPNNIIDSNYLHNSGTNFSSSRAIYLDDGSESFIVSNNLGTVFNGSVKSAIMLKGDNHIIENNMIKDSLIECGILVC
jgi:hypothetical protein